MTSRRWPVWTALAASAVAGCSADASAPPVAVAAATAAVAPAPDATAVPDGWPTTTGPVAPARTGGTPASQRRTAVPTVLVLPSGSRADVEPAGVHADGALAVPDDPARVGWWTGGAKVGEPFGSVVLAGHVDSRRFGIGVMAELLDVRVGAVVHAGDGSVSRQYEVTSVEQVPRARLGTDTDAFRQDVPHRLVLITCSGDFDPATRRYADNLVVTATAVG